MHRLQRCMLLLAAAPLAGCLIIPTDYYTPDSRRNVDNEPLTMILPGTTTRQELLLSLGEPDAASADETELWYVASKIRAIIIVGDRGDEYQVDYCHSLRLDGRGRVMHVQQYEMPVNRPEIGASVYDDVTSTVVSSPEPHYSRELLAPPHKE